MTAVAYRVVAAHFTNGAYGFPRLRPRRIRPRRLACVHITGNPGMPPARAIGERNYANRDRDFGTSSPDYGPTAHWYVDREEALVVDALDTTYAAWSNGDLLSPDTRVPGIADVVALDRKAAPGGGTYNANEDYVREYEACGNYRYPITVRQRDIMADRIARDSIEWDIPITRATVHLHSDINTVNRPNCPTPRAGKEAWVAALIARANAIRAELEPGQVIEEDEMLELTLEAEDWTPTVTAGVSNGVFRGRPDRTAPLLADATGKVIRMPANTVITTVGKIDTRPDIETVDDDWRSTRLEDGRTAFMHREVDWAPVPGSREKRTAQLVALIRRELPDVAAARRLAAAGAIEEARDLVLAASGGALDQLAAKYAATE